MQYLSRYPGLDGAPTPNVAGCWQVVELGLSLHSLYL